MVTEPIRAHRRERVAVAIEFALKGCITGSWAARIPDVRAQLPLSDAKWGLANIGLTIGSLVALFTTIALVGRIGPRRLALTGALLLLIVAPILAASRQPLQLIIFLLLQGLATGLLAPGMNAQAVEVERRYRRRIMSSFHACFSLGQLTGGLAGTIAAQFGVNPSAQLTATSAVLFVLLATSFGQLPADEARLPAAVAKVPLRARIRPQLVLLAGIALLASINEGVAVQWSAQYTAVGLAAGAGLGAATFTAFSVAMAGSRLFGDRLVNRIGQRRFIRISEIVVALGLAGALTVATPWAAIAGFALVGVGSACIVPTVMGLAGRQPGLTAGQSVSVVSLGQWPAFLIGPPLIGLLAGLVTLRWSLSLVVLSAAGIVLIARWVRPPSAEPARILAGSTT